jgi:acetylglutamate kinase
MQVVEMVLAGQINKNIVGLIQRHGGKAVGLCGKDGNLLMASKMLGDGGVDLGFVGRIDQVNPDIVANLVNDGFVPVVAPIATDAEGGSYNINADTAAAELAQALGAEKLILLTDVAGILDTAGKLQPFLNVRDARAQIRKGSISEGMVPKVECAMEALEGGVSQVHIIDGRVSHAVLLEIFTRGGVGTEVVPDKPAAAEKPAVAKSAAGAKASKTSASR